MFDLVINFLIYLFQESSKLLYEILINNFTITVFDTSYIVYYYVVFIKLTNININKKQISILAVVTAMAVVMTVSPFGMIFSNNIAFAGGKDHDNDDDDDGNSASQIIAQVQRSIQNSQVVSGGDTEDSGNNFNFQNQENSGNNALAQQ